MRLSPTTVERKFGALRLRGPCRVTDLDSGTDLSAIEASMAVVISVRNEPISMVQGVLAAIPRSVTVVVVSASDRHPQDRYRHEQEVVRRLAIESHRSVFAIHQFDSGVAEAATVGLVPELVDAGSVRSGKGEAMLIGTMLVMGIDPRFQSIGFIDADNWVPGAVHEYVKAFATGLGASSSPLAMVRIAWPSKPKMINGDVVLRRWGRTSAVSNRFLNALLEERFGPGSGIVVTANSGELAMSTELARQLRFSGGYTAELSGLLDLLERSAHAESTDVIQIETLNPHFHTDRGQEHVLAMQRQNLAVLLTSPLCSASFREKIEDYLGDQFPPQPITYPPLGETDPRSFATTIQTEAESFVMRGPDR